MQGTKWITGEQIGLYNYISVPLVAISCINLIITTASAYGFVHCLVQKKGFCSGLPKCYSLKIKSIEF